MSVQSIEFHRLEQYFIDGRDVICSFDTGRAGYLQVGFDGNSIYELNQEPDLHILTVTERLFISSISAIVWRMVFDGERADFE